MSLRKNISGGPLDVPLLDRVIDVGEVVDVPDVQADGESPIVWPPDKWEAVAGPQDAQPDAAPDTAADISGEDMLCRPTQADCQARSAQ